MESMVVSALKVLKEKPPEMIIGGKSIKLLSAFVAGLEYVDTKSWTHMPKYYFRGAFNQWVAEKFNISDSLGWEGLILIKANNDDEKAYDLFYLLLDEYLQEINAK